MLDGGVFALGPSWIAGSDAEIAELAAERGVPLVAPLTREAHQAAPPAREVFYLLSGIRDQARVLAAWAADTGGVPGGPAPPLAVAFPDAGEQAAAGRAAVAEAEARGCERVETHRWPAGRFDAAALVAGLRRSGVARLLFLGDAGEAEALVRAAAALAWSPELLAPGELAGGGLATAPLLPGGRLVLSLPTVAAARSAAARAELDRLLGGEVEGAAAGTAALALAGARLLLEGLERAGRRLSREALIDALEGLYRFETGLTPPLSYDPNRRIGARGAWVLELDPATGDRPPPRWWPLDG
jgi:ABC-type branched-subunit amino acid transport system substrate-binding protein